jgi:hypothetical protein
MIHFGICTASYSRSRVMVVASSKCLTQHPVTKRPERCAIHASLPMKIGTTARLRLVSNTRRDLLHRSLAAQVWLPCSVSAAYLVGVALAYVLTLLGGFRIGVRNGKGRIQLTGYLSLPNLLSIRAYCKCTNRHAGECWCTLVVCASWLLSGHDSWYNGHASAPR